MAPSKCFEEGLIIIGVEANYCETAHHSGVTVFNCVYEALILIDTQVNINIAFCIFMSDLLL